MSSKTTPPNTKASSQTDALAFWSNATYIRTTNLKLQNSEPCSGPPALVERVIDDEIAALQGVLRFWKTKRNKFVAKSSILPPEVLSRVFEFLALAHPYRHDVDATRGGSSPRLGWIVVSHICRHWRQVAVDDTSLWRTISSEMEPKWIAEMVARTKDRPLTVDIKYRWSGGNFTSQTSTTLSTHLCRTGDLAIAVGAPLFNHLLRHMSAPAPMLDVLDIQITGSSTIAEVPVSLVLFEGQAPRLRRISLSGIHVSWSSLPVATLTHLSLVGSASEATRHTSSTAWCHFLGFLEQSPMLEVLVLEGDYLPRDPPLSSAGRIANLPHMVEISLSGHSSSVANVLSQITIPTSTRVFLECNFNDLEDCSTLLHPATSYMRALTSARTFGMVFGVGALYLIISEEDEELNDGSMPTGGSSRFPLVISWKGRFSDSLLTSIVQRLSEELPSLGMKTLVLSSYHSFKSSPWLELFCRFEEVENLWIRSLVNAHPIFFSALAESSMSSSVREGRSLPLDYLPRSAIIFPRLRLLSIAIDLIGLDRGFQSLLEMLKERQRRGTGLARLLISSTNELLALNRTQVRSLNSLVKRLEGRRPVHPERTGGASHLAYEDPKSTTRRKEGAGQGFENFVYDFNLALMADERHV